MPKSITMGLVKSVQSLLVRFPGLSWEGSMYLKNDWDKIALFDALQERLPGPIQMKILTRFSHSMSDLSCFK
jgi:hypothetical protein